MTVKKTLGIAALAITLSTPGFAQQAFTIGGLLPFSGPYGVLGQNARRGVELAIAEREGKVLGRPIEVIWEDTETKPQVAVQKASRLLAGKVDMIFGAASSGETLAVIPLVTTAKVPLLITLSADDRITGASKTRYAFRTSNNLSMESLMLLEEIKASGASKIYGVASDLGATRDGWSKDIRPKLEKLGKTIVGEDFPPFGSRDYSVIIDKVAKSGADTVVVIAAGSDSIGFLKNAAEIGLGKKVKIMGPVLIDDSTLKAVGAGIEGVMSALRYHYSLNNAANKKFVDAYMKAYGERPDWVAGESYDGMSWWLDVVQSTGTSDREKWVDAFKQSSRPNSIEGLKKMRACDNQAEQIGIWAKGVKSGEGYSTAVTRVIDNAALFPPCQ